MGKSSFNFYLIFYQLNNISSPESIRKCEFKLNYYFSYFSSSLMYYLRMSFHVLKDKITIITKKTRKNNTPTNSPPQKNPLEFQRLQDILEEIEFWSTLTTSSGSKCISFLIMSWSDIMNEKVLTSLKCSVGLNGIVRHQLRYAIP